MESSHGGWKRRQSFGVCYVHLGDAIMINTLSASMALVRLIEFSGKHSESEPILSCHCLLSDFTSKPLFGYPGSCKV